MKQREEKKELEDELKNYLSVNTQMIEKYLKDSFIHYDSIKINSLDIVGGDFICHCLLSEDFSRSIVLPRFPIPVIFLRSKKLKKIKDEHI